MMSWPRLLSLLALLCAVYVALPDASAQATPAPPDRPSVRNALAREFGIMGTVDCGRKSGARCEPDSQGRIVLWTEDISGARERVTIDVSWILSQLGRLDQDDKICLDVQDGEGGVLRAVGVVGRCGEDEPRKRPTPEKDPKVQADATITPTTTVTPTPTVTLSPTATPVINLSLTKTGDYGTCMGRACATEWTITILNSGPNVAHNVVVIDRPLAGLTTVASFTASQGTFNTATNRWTVGTVGVGPGNAQTLTITFNPSNPDSMSGGWENEVEVEAANEVDSNSTPNNNNPAEDDQDSEILFELE